MKACGGCSTWIPDGAAFCPSCGRAQGEAGPQGVTPSLPPAGPPPPRPGGQEFRVRTEESIRRLGLLYMVFGGIVLLVDFYSFYLFASGSALRTIQDLMTRFPPEVGEWVLDVYRSPSVLAVIHVVPFAMGVLLVHSGNSLRSLRGRTPALVAAVLCIVLALFTRFCCCVSVPLGIFALVVLTRPDVEAVLKK